MANIRVYELARDLNMKNKTLLDRLSEIDISVRSHMSTLDDDAVEKVRAHIFGKKPASFEEIRVKPTIIRRRKKAISAELEVEEPEVEEAEIAPEQAFEVEPAKEAPPVEEVTVEEAVAVEMRVEESPVSLEPEVPEAQADARIEAQPVVEAAEISAPVVEEQMPPAVEETGLQPEAVAPSQPETAEAGQPVEAKAPAIEEVTGTVFTLVQPETARPEPEAPKPAKQPPLKKKKHIVEPRRERKDTPAKIIKLPVQRVEPQAEAEKKPARPAEVLRPLIKKAEPKAPETEEAAARDKRKKKGKKPGEEVEDKKFFKKKISFRTKEVIEGADLYAEGQRPRKAQKSAKAKPVPVQPAPVTIPKAIKRRLKIDETIMLSELAKRMGIKAADMIKKLMLLGVMATVNQTIDFETAVLVAQEFGYELEKAAFEEETLLKMEKDAPEKLAHRPPVVTIMGHVDHGKTSLLDVIRQTRVTENEAGGITQHIGAYHVSTEKGNIVFLDTPGHEAFTSMRSRGAKVTDIVILVVAADDGVMPQTVEAINHSRAAGVPIIVAVNKMDKPNADPERVQRQLSELGLMPEDWGGDTIFVKVSAKKKQGINELLEMILLQAELMELKANPDKLAIGHVVEAKLDSGRGPVATVLVKEGTLRNGDAIVCGVHYGRVRAMLDDQGMQLDSAGPAIPVEVVGLTGVPMAGDEMIAMADEKDAKQVSAHRMQKQRSVELAQTGRMSLEKLYERMQQGKAQDLNLIIKADVHGSLEALRDSLTKLSGDQVRINILHTATGTITESDVSLAAVSDAIIIGFNVRPSAKVQEMANEERVDIRYHNIIYDAIQEMKNAIVGMMPSTFEERVLGRAEVREVFQVPKVGAIAGSYVTDGRMERNQHVRVLRDGIVVYSGKISSLRRFKDDVKEVQTGYECGIGVEKFNDIKVGDVLECYYMEEIRPEI